MSNAASGDARTRFVTGATHYVGDLASPESAWLAVVRSDVPHGILRAVDTAAAGSTSGVLAVLTAADLEPIPCIPIRVGPTPILERRLQPVLAVDRVRYVGEPIAAVIAETPAAAEHASALVLADIDPLPAAATPDSQAVVWEDLDSDTFIDLTAADGDLDAAFRSATTVIALSSSVGRKTGLPIEPRGLAARWDRGRLHLWGPTKFISFTRETLATLLDVTPGDVVIHRVDVGGMFGVRGEFYPEDFLVPWASRLLDRPVRWEERRREHMVSINQSGAQWHTMRLGLAGDGRPVAFDADVVVDAGAYPRPIGSRIAHIVVETMAGPYDWDAFRVRCRTVATHRTPTGTVRGPAAFESTFARERALDVAARTAGRDPLEVRRAGLIPATAMPYRRPGAAGEHDVVFDSGDFTAILDTLLEHAGYDDLVAQRDRRSAAGERVGVGLGLFVIHSALGAEEPVTVDLEEGGRFLVRTAASDVGQGLDAMAGSVVGHALGVPVEEVSVWSGDSEAQEGGKGTFSSRSTVFVANALGVALERLRDAAARRAAALLECSPAQISFDAGGPGNGEDVLRWKEVAPLTAAGEFRMERPTYGFGAHLALVSVDEATGTVRTEHLGIVYDCGRALDPASVSDQIRGAAVAAVGASIHEELRFDEQGTPLSTSLSDYLLPTAAGVPTIDVIVCENAPAPGNPLGIKGVGEAGVIGAGAAIANAVADAIDDDSGAVVCRLPIQPAAIAARVGRP